MVVVVVVLLLLLLLFVFGLLLVRRIFPLVSSDVICLSAVEKLVAGHGADVVCGEKVSELQLVLSTSLDSSVCIWSLDSG